MPTHKPSSAGGAWSLPLISSWYLRICGAEMSIRLPLTVRASLSLPVAIAIGRSVPCSPRADQGLTPGAAAERSNLISKLVGVVALIAI